MDTEYIKARDAAAEETAKNMLSSKFPDYPQTFRKHDLIKFSEIDFKAGADWGHQYESPAVKRMRNALTFVSSCKNLDRCEHCVKVASAAVSDYDAERAKGAT